MAWKLSQKALTEAPESAAAHEFAGEVLFRHGDFVQAEGEFQRALKLDAHLGLAWWGLGRIAECESRHKTAGSYSRRAYELDPRDRRIFLDWALRLPGQQLITALEKYLSIVDPSRDREQLKALRQEVELFKALNGRDVMVLASPYKASEIPLATLLNDGKRAYGLEISVNGNTLRLLLDTGASGILIKPGAAEKSRVTRLSDAAFRGVGDNTKPASGYRGMAENVRIGDVEFRNVLISVSEKEFLPNQDGLIGTNVFSQFLITLDFANRSLHLDPLSSNDGSGESTDRTIPQGMEHFTPVFRFGHMLLIPTRVGDSREALFLIDTGATQTVISYDMAAQIGKVRREERLRVDGIGGKVPDVYQSGGLYLQFAGFRQNSLGVTAFDMRQQSHSLGTEVSGFLGLPVLTLFKLTIDYRDGLVNFDYRGH